LIEDRAVRGRRLAVTTGVAAAAMALAACQSQATARGGVNVAISATARPDAATPVSSIPVRPDSAVE
jgi:cobalamin biosynthesis protein CbiD